jgi:hypothetical protein
MSNTLRGYLKMSGEKNLIERLDESKALPFFVSNSINQFIDWSTYSLTSLFVSDSLTT